VAYARIVYGSILSGSPAFKFGASEACCGGRLQRMQAASIQRPRLPFAWMRRVCHGA
jgi:hypothetical protein